LGLGLRARDGHGKSKTAAQAERSPRGQAPGRGGNGHRARPRSRRQRPPRRRGHGRHGPLREARRARGHQAQHRLEPPARAGRQHQPRGRGRGGRLVAAAGAGKIWVTDVSVNTAEQCFARSGIEKAAKAAGAIVVRPDATAFREVDVSGKLLRTGDVLFPFVEADRVINVPVVKQHGLSGATMAMKNWYGMLGGQRVKLHQNIHLSIVDLAAMIKPTLTIMDATRILLANGPTGGSLADVKQMDTIAVSTDEVALDAFGAGLLGLSPADLGFIVEGMKAGLGTPTGRSLKTEELGG
jgi:hypothetical protein